MNIDVFDTTLRDGEQVPGCQLTSVEKIEIALELEALGVDIIEAGFPVSSPGDFRSVQDVCDAVHGPIICVLARAVKEDIDIAAASVKHAKRKRIHLGIGASDFHIKHKFNSTREDILERARWSVQYAKQYVEDVEFYAEDAGRADKVYLAQMVEAVIKEGATVVNIPDTNGYATPDQYGAIFRYLTENVKDVHKIVLASHCHNDLGLATANSLAAIINGARQVECTINGIGERAGNTSLEEIAMILKIHSSLGFTTHIQSKRLYALSKQVEYLMRMPVQANKAIVGANAFAHSSGIHQDGVLKNRQNYEIIDPEEVGFPSSSIVLTARSGRHALKYRFEKLGYALDKAEVDAMYTVFLQLADVKKEIHDADLEALINSQSTALSQKRPQRQVPL